MPGFREVVRCSTVRHARHRRGRPRDQLPTLRNRPSQLLAVRVVRPRQPLRVHGTTIPARISPKNARNSLHPLHARAPPSNAKPRRRAPTTRARRSTTCSISSSSSSPSASVPHAPVSRWDNRTWLSLRTGPATRRSAAGDPFIARSAALLHADHRCSGIDADRAADHRRDRLPQ